MQRMSGFWIGLFIVVLILIATNPNERDFTDEMADYISHCEKLSRDEARDARLFAGIVGAFAVDRSNYFVGSVFRVGDSSFLGLFGMTVNLQTDPDFRMLRVLVRNCDP